MMKQPWKIWSVFAFTLLVLVAATVWLSIKTIELDQQQEQDRIQTELARREAELQERINSALYRMDWVLTPLISQEAARPYYLYDSFYRPPVAQQQAGIKSKIREILPEEPSPLLMETSDFVKLHFQLGSDDKITSPQRPTGFYCRKAITTCGIAENEVTKYDSLLKDAQSFARFEVIQFLCPQTQDIAPGQGGLAEGQTVYLDNYFNDKYEVESQIVDQLAQTNMQSQQEILGNNALEIQRNRGQSRGDNEFKQRKRSAEKFAQQQWNSSYNNPGNIRFNASDEAPIVREGMMRPVWVGDELLLVRRVRGKKRELIQCCWLNWERIREELRREVKDILPEVELSPVSPDHPIDFGRALASIPAKVVVDSEKLLSQLAIAQPLDNARGPGVSGIRWALILAWLGLLFAAGAVAFMLQGVIQLSERRATFVSAVTHELRTPLTTFKMYAEMLAAEMVPEEKKKDYALTLTSQADRLSHLVENVLQFARLEKVTCGSKQIEVPVEQIFDPFRDRLEQRAADSQMGLEIETPNSDLKVPVELSKLEQIVFNLVDNACKYGQGAKNQIDLKAEVRGRNLVIRVRDYGPGVARKVRKNCFNRFQNRTRKRPTRPPASGWDWPCANAWSNHFAAN